MDTLVLHLRVVLKTPPAPVRNTLQEVLGPSSAHSMTLIEAREK